MSFFIIRKDLFKDFQISNFLIVPLSLTYYEIAYLSKLSIDLIAFRQILFLVQKLVKYRVHVIQIKTDGCWMSWVLWIAFSFTTLFTLGALSH